MVFPAGAPEQGTLLPGRKLVRVAFNGTQTTDKPLVASLDIECGIKATILGAETKNIEGKAFGYILMGLPEDPAEAARAINSTAG